MRLRSLLAVVTAVMVVHSGAAWALWSDRAEVTADLSADPMLPPVSVTCTSLLLAATVSWPDRGPAYDYQAVLRRSDGTAVGDPRLVTGTGRSVTYDGLTAFGLTWSLVGTHVYTVEVRSYLADKPAWLGNTSITYSRITVVVLATLTATVTCG